QGPAPTKRLCFHWARPRGWQRNGRAVEMIILRGVVLSVSSPPPTPAKSPRFPPGSGLSTAITHASPPRPRFCQCIHAIIPHLDFTAKLSYVNSPIGKI